MAISFMAPDLV